MGRFDVSGLGKLQRQMKKALNEAGQRGFAMACAGRLAEELLKRVVERTPVGDYSGNSYVCNPSDTGQIHKGGSKVGKQSGALRDGWRYGIREWQGDKFIVEVINVAKNENGEAYASYVEYGHGMPRGMKPAFVPGHFMMEISRKEVMELAPKMLENLLTMKLMEVFKT